MKFHKVRNRMIWKSDINDTIIVWDCITKAYAIRKGCMAMFNLPTLKAAINRANHSSFFNK